MSTFDQRDQVVIGDQTNVGHLSGGIHRSQIETRAELLEELGRLQSELVHIANSGGADAQVSGEAHQQVDLAIAEANAPAPDRSTVARRLAAATALLEGVGSAVEVGRALGMVIQQLQGILG